MVRAVVVAMILSSSVAVADPAPDAEVAVATAEPPGMTAPDIVVTAPPAATVPMPMPIDQPRGYDAAYDRAFAYGTALALRPGDFDVSLRSVLRHGAMLSVAAGVGGGVELSVQGIKSSYVGEAVGTGVKVTVVHERRIAVAFDANMFAFLSGGGSNGSDQRMYSASMILTTCVTPDCSVVYDAGAGIAVATAEYNDAQFLPTLHTSLLVGSSWARPMFELAWLNGWMGFAGMRFGYRHIGVDVGLGMLSDEAPGGSATTALVGLNVRP